MKEAAARTVLFDELGGFQREETSTVCLDVVFPFGVVCLYRDIGLSERPMLRTCMHSTQMCSTK